MDIEPGKSQSFQGWSKIEFENSMLAFGTNVSINSKSLTDLYPLIGSDIWNSNSHSFRIHYCRVDRLLRVRWRTESQRYHPLITGVHLRRIRTKLFLWQLNNSISSFLTRAQYANKGKSLKDNSNLKMSINELIPPSYNLSFCYKNRTICLVQVPITAPTGFPLASSNAAHKSSVKAFLYWCRVR